jgi:hypothetical protein
VTDEYTDQPEDLSEPERYDTAEGWCEEPPDERKLQKLLADYRKNNPEEFRRNRSMFTTKPARRWQQDAETRHKPKTELYGPLWRTGEIAVLFGEPAAGKSILAVQLADAIAR